ncbi:hypothetical protein MNBD_NITROSPINAE03-345, partial [hydrothermal vent metagenome]
WARQILGADFSASADETDDEQALLETQSVVA